MNTWRMTIIFTFQKNVKHQTKMDKKNPKPDTHENSWRTYHYVETQTK